MKVTISIDGKITQLNKAQRNALRQACAIEQHKCLQRRDNLIQTQHMKDELMEQALFLCKLHKDLTVLIPHKETTT